MGEGEINNLVAVLPVHYLRPASSPWSVLEMESYFVLSFSSKTVINLCSVTFSRSEALVLYFEVDSTY